MWPTHDLARVPAAMSVIEKEFNSLAPVYETNRLSAWYRAHADEILAVCRNLPAGDILDVGCGTGYLLRNYLKHNPAARGVGLDVSAEMISEATKRARSEQVENVEFFQVNFEEIETSAFESYDFRIIVCASVFHYFSDPKQAAITLYSMLAEDGVLYLLERDKSRSLLTRIWDFLHRNYIKDNVEFYDKSELLRIFEQAGFKSPQLVRSIRRYFWKGKLFTSIALIQFRGNEGA